VTDSRIISSNQAGIHQDLEKLLRRHLGSRFRRPFPDYSLQVFEQANQQVSQHRGPIILDSYCGVGESTVNIARQFPEALVIGVDKSSHRLDKHETHAGDQPVENYQLYRADVDDFWRLSVAAGWQLQRHYLLYPNPWPKSTHLKRRVHGSPLFPTLLELGGRVELRSNWPVYVQEFAEALSIAGHLSDLHSFLPEPAITPFERKYQASGQTLWRCTSQL
jgi:tRNA G46 methylase TrmB